MKSFSSFCLLYKSYQGWRWWIKYICKLCLSSPGPAGSVSSESRSATCDLCLHCEHSFCLCPMCALEKSLVLPMVGCWMSNCRRLRCYHREGRAPLLSECVTQQPLLWMREKCFGLMFGSVRLCFERRRRMVKMKTGYICFQKGNVL